MGKALPGFHNRFHYLSIQFKMKPFHAHRLRWLATFLASVLIINLPLSGMH